MFNFQFKVLEDVGHQIAIGIKIGATEEVRYDSAVTTEMTEFVVVTVMTEIVK